MTRECETAMQIFSIEGYYEDDPDCEITGLICSLDCTPKGYSQDDFLWFGLSESDLKHAIESEEPCCDGIIITNYKEE